MKIIIESILKFVSNDKAISIKKDKVTKKPTGGVTFKSLDLRGLLASEEYKKAIEDTEYTINYGFKDDKREVYENGYKKEITISEDYLYIGPDMRKSYTSADDIMADLEA